MRILVPLLTGTLLTACASMSGAPDLDRLQQEVLDAERGFARTMADRDHAAFRTFLSQDAIFYSGETPTRGSTAVAAAWEPFFAGPTPPFSWDPDGVQVLGSGDLALSTGPVRDPAGNIVGRFNSIWRLENGRWRVVFDKGSPVCNCQPQPQTQ